MEKKFPELNLKTLDNFEPSQNDQVIELPINSVVIKRPWEAKFYKLLKYPWDLLDVDRIVLDTVKEQVISVEADISNTVKIYGSCIIEKGATVEDFVKIRGPIFIGENSSIGTGGLIRDYAYIGPETTIGFCCEIARTHLFGKNVIAHYNVIPDSILGEGTYFAGYTTTCNLRLDEQNVMYKIGDRFIDTGRRRLGAITGRNVKAGAGVLILPGRYIASRCIIPQGSIVRHNMSKIASTLNEDF